jgi:hypothetical protein
MDRILDNGAAVLRNEYRMVYFPGDDLFAVGRPRRHLGTASSAPEGALAGHPATEAVRCKGAPGAFLISLPLGWFWHPLTSGQPSG